MHQQEREQFREFVEQALTDSGYDLVDVVLSKRSGTVFVSVLVDLPHGGISISQCAEVNRMIGQAMFDQGTWDGPYELEVSSPGLDRAMTCRKDFLRNQGRQVRVFLTEKVGDNTEYIGTIRQVDEEYVEIVKEGEPARLPLSKITKAVQII